MSATSSDPAAILNASLQGESPEVEISKDMIKRGIIVAPVLIAIAGMIWGSSGAWSAAYGIAIVLVNFALAAALIAISVRISYAALLAATLFGYILRLGLIFLAVWLVRDASWISMPAVGMSIIVTHLGLLVWELKYVAISLAYPGLKPRQL